MIEINLLPEKSKFPIAEAARYVARHLSITEKAAKSRLYRKIEEGKIKARYVLGVMYLDHETLKDTLNGASKWEIF
jgi:hypothetical protein